MNANPLEDWPTMPEIRKRYVVEAFYEIGREFQVAKTLNMDYRTVSAILRKEKLLPQESHDDAGMPLFPNDDANQTKPPVE
jgi:hypothetical protein